MKPRRGGGARRKAKVPEGAAGKNCVAGGAKTSWLADVNESADEIIAEATEAGIDLELTRHNLTLTPEQRAEQHDSALELALELKRIGEEMRASDHKAA